jgi:hypothetical protein
MNVEEIRKAAERLHQRRAAISISLALDNFDRSESAQDETYQRIIEFRKNAKTVPEDERAGLEKRIADYSNALAKNKIISEVRRGSNLSSRFAT